jgi:hypothetical protein
MTWAVVVGLGNAGRHCYAQGIRLLKDAEKLMDAAIERGYKDATVEAEESVRNQGQEERRGQASPRRFYRSIP